MPKRPTYEQLQTAIMWLEVNEGTDGEAEACHAVAKWLQQDHEDRLVRNAARKIGMPVGRVRDHLKAKGVVS